ncbi:unnamed protein product [Trichobilharzia szidati]|nr:unnamed protein product [Trichobilharzia szidati]
MAVTRVAVILGEILDEEQKPSLVKDAIPGLTSCPSDLLAKFQSHLNGLTSNQQCSLECIFCHQSEDFEFRILCRPSLSAITSLLTSYLVPPKKPDVALNVILIYAGLLSEGSAHWLLPDCVLTPAFLVDFIHHLSTLHPKSDDAENQPCPKPIRLHIGIGGVTSGGEWRQLVNTPPQSIGGHTFQVTVNRCRTTPKAKGHGPTDITSPSASSFDFESFLCDVMSKLPDPYCPPLSQALTMRSPTDPTIKVSKPCIYVFPEGSGQASILALPGYTMLINGGCSYKPNFWPVANYLDGLDSVFLTQWSVDNLLGLSEILPTVFTPKNNNNDNSNNNQPFLCLLTPPPNISQTKVNLTGQQQDSQLQFPISLPMHFSNLIGKLKRAGTNLVVYPLTRGGKQSVLPKSIQLFQKVGQGSLELFPLTPGDDDSAELRKLTDDWSKASPSLMTTTVPLSRTPGNKTSVPLLSYTSVSALVVWRPAKDTEPILRILFVSPNAHQTRILSSLDALISGFIYLRHSKAVPAEYERKRPVQPLSAGIRRPTVATTTHAASASNESIANSTGQNHHNTARLSQVPKKTTAQRPPSSASTSSKNVTNKPSPLTKTPVKVNESAKDKSAAEANSQHHETCANDDVLPSPENLPAESTDISSDIMNGDDANNIIGGADDVIMHKPANGYVNDASDCEPSSGDLKQPINNGGDNEFIIHNNNNLNMNMNTPIKLQEHAQQEFHTGGIPQENEVSPNDGFKHDPIASWGMPQNLPLPTGPDASKKPPPPTATAAAGATTNGDKKPTSHMPTRRLTSVNSASLNVNKTSRLSLAPRPATHTNGSNQSTATYSPGYTIASGHITSGKAPLPSPYDKVKPIYVDVAFLPGGGNSNYVDAEWFKRVRARYYVATDVRPTCSLLESLVVGKESWNGDDAQLEVSLVLAYETEELLIWLGVNAGRLNACHINLASVISRSIIQIMNEATSSTGDGRLSYPGYRIDLL